jgi:primosomal protein N' (replication factor Y) (superfamily II helicase)
LPRRDSSFSFLTGMKLAKILIDGPSELIFDYEVPSDLNVKVGCRVRVPLRNKDSTGTVLAIEESLYDLGYSPRPIRHLIDPEPLITPVLMKLGRWMSEYYIAPMEHVMRALLPESVRQDVHQEKTRKVVKLAKELSDEAREELKRKAPKQFEIYLLTKAVTIGISLSDLNAAAVKALEKKGYVVIEDEPVRRDPDEDQQFVESNPIPLNTEQQVVLDRLLQMDLVSSKKPVLLHGVTGSGKTEVYLQAVQAILDRGKSALILVPEIALTPQTVQRFKSRFAKIQEQVAVMHSNLGQGERFDEWHRIRKGEAKIVIGARSAVFAPLKNLGLIVVDEEHETSYKQEVAPRYHGRDIAVLRAHFENCLVLLGSATPSLESYANTLKDKYELLTMKQRVDGQALPIIRVMDMRMEAQKQKSNIVVLSDKLRLSMEEKLANGEQVILFLNRRGFSRSLQCPPCGHVCECKFCSIPLTYHRSVERLICHVCGHQAIVPRKCPECGDEAIRFQGYGTEKVQEVIEKVFSKYKIARIDADTMGRKNALRDTLNAFKAKKIDIIIGTQMIAKGLHFPNVTLVGVLNADLGLHVPDFRSGERTFQLLTQVAGRAGRGVLEGEVIVQTCTPHSPSIQFARHHDFYGYAEQELLFRQQFSYPPYGHCSVLATRSNNERLAEFTLECLHKRLKENIPKGIELGEPVPSPLVRAHGQYRFQLTIRCPNARLLSQHVRSVLDRTPSPEDVTVVFDMDSYSFF